jgi:hypothetical protein
MDAPTGTLPQVCTHRPDTTWPSCRCDVHVAEVYRLRKLLRSGAYVPPLGVVEAGMESLRVMRGRGWSPVAIATATGIPDPTMHKICAGLDAGRDVRVSVITARRLASPGVPTGGCVGAVGTMRRVRALARVGWDNEAIAVGAGLSLSTVRAFGQGARVQVSAVSADAVQGFFDRRGGGVGPSWRAVARGVAAGWPRPVDWVGIDMDDPVVVCPGFPQCDAPVAGGVRGSGV